MKESIFLPREFDLMLLTFMKFLRQLKLSVLTVRTGWSENEFDTICL
jgi:hypothetical protein